MRIPFCSLLVLFLAASTHAEIIHLLSTNGVASRSIVVGTNEVLKVAEHATEDTTDFVYTIQGVTFTNNAYGGYLPDIHTVAGPATVHIRGRPYLSPPVFSIVTLELTRAVPAVQASNAVVIPDDASGPVQIILESSSDFVTWTAANPGTYGTSTQKRFFRLRAMRQ